MQGLLRCSIQIARVSGCLSFCGGSGLALEKCFDCAELEPSMGMGMPGQANEIKVAFVRQPAEGLRRYPEHFAGFTLAQD